MAWTDENAEDIVIIRPTPGGGGSGSSTFPGGTTDYNLLENHPRIEGNELRGDKTFESLGLQPIANSYIDSLFT